MSKAHSSRHYGPSPPTIDEAVTSALQVFELCDVPLAEIMPSPSLQVSNSFAVNEMFQSIVKRGLLRASPSILWYCPTPPHILIKGYTKYQALCDAKGLDSVTALFVKFPCHVPTVENVFFAATVCTTFGTSTRLISEETKLLQVIDVVRFLQARGMKRSTIKVSNIRQMFPKLQEGIAYHWSLKLGDDSIRQFLGTALVLNVQSAISALQFIEREAYNPSVQVSQSFLFKLKRMEEDEKGSGINELTGLAARLRRSGNKGIRASWKPNRRSRRDGFALLKDSVELARKGIIKLKAKQDNKKLKHLESLLHNVDEEVNILMTGVSSNGDSC